ncbi:MAG: hypothetical protein WD512_16960, partial [Candidatus Paceibacterota bacterium]
HKFPAVSLSVGGTALASGEEGKTALFSLYGGKEYYNSRLFKNGDFRPDEPNLYVQFQVGINEDNSTQLTLNWFKQKYKKDEKGFDFEAPTAVHLGLGFSKNVTTIGSIDINTNFSFSGGIELGLPRHKLGDEVDFYGKENGYSVIGWGAPAIYRVDAKFTKTLGVFISASFHHQQTFDIESSIGTKVAETNGSAAINFGVTTGIGGGRIKR